MCDQENINSNEKNVDDEKEIVEKERDEQDYKEYLEFRGEIIDSHCHIHEDVEHIKESLELPFKKMLLMGTTVQDWDRVNKLLESSGNNQDRFIRCFGIHPWFVYQINPPKELLGTTNSENNEVFKIDESWYSTMKEQLLKYPDSLVGEVGIDKVTKVKQIGKNDQESQMAVFSKQISLANELNRLVSLHCVQLHGPLLKYFQDLPIDKFPPKIALHTFGGKPATVVQFSKMAGGKGDRFYFGLSFINLTSSKIEKLIQAIPDDRILIESDQSTPLKAEASIFKLIQKISRSKNWTIQKTIQQTALNALKFISK
ncbi:hypothetical protein DICPUDRAFT_157997 [Dictyostelium purpureum]|uniref:Uncharacterized protein n=1 Tax=Dictyostelium purpureum TaxID=5786 RepID=F1A0J7_DICPU|nr:uncharacterized protein DICPUDRAFT_157997 [Dictyostelium purpureum]EGC30289.1 hypothetical protein DICPUDRAFT_157997 [Dictyostelium purpureum]|eukprot:XP_003293192.1 hypothetical protein DICPUDRAFT_157997 [Dictyostelium purpureum]